MPMDDGVQKMFKLQKLTQEIKMLLMSEKEDGQNIEVMIVSRERNGAKKGFWLTPEKDAEVHDKIKLHDGAEITVEAMA